jgi:16S rRNA (uracil1498-N3)-methyltransferase
MSERFFLATPPQGGSAVLDGDEARHLARVLRARVGDVVTLFDGRGRAWQARVTRIARDTVELEAVEPNAVEPNAVEPTAVARFAGEPAPPRAGPRLTLAVALPKGERQKWMVEKLTELGVARLVPLETARGVAEATASAAARLERQVIEACKQCGRDTLMEVAAGRPLDRVLADLPAGARGVIAHPHAPPLEAAAVHAGATEVIALVGPEGGFTADELAAADRAGAVRVSLGPHILRVETAAIALAARLVPADPS